MIHKNSSSKITKNKVLIYKKCGADSDVFARQNRDMGESMPSGDWHFLNTLFADMEVLKKGLGSEKLKRSVEKRLAENCGNDPETIQLIEEMVENQKWRNAGCLSGIFNFWRK